MAIRAIDPRENSRQLTDSQSRAVRLENLEQRLDEFTTSFDMKLRRQKDELISEFKILLQEQMEAIMSKLAIAEPIEFSVEKTSSSQPAEVFEKSPESRIQPVPLKFSPTVVVTAHDTLHPESNEDFVGLGGDFYFKSNLNSYQSASYLDTKIRTSRVARLYIRGVDENVDDLVDTPISDTGYKISFICCSVEALGEGNLRNEILAKFSSYIYLFGERGMAKVKLKCLIKQPERPLPPPEPPPYRISSL